MGYKMDKVGKNFRKNLIIFGNSMVNMYHTICCTYINCDKRSYYKWRI